MTVYICNSKCLTIDKTNEYVLKAVMMEGYVSSKCERKSVKGREFELTTFQGEHCDEYVVKEEKSGECRLYRKGVLELSWREENGHRTGGFTVYEKGKVLRKEN